MCTSFFSLMIEQVIPSWVAGVFVADFLGFLRTDQPWLQFQSTVIVEK
jgi:hypothetical protein